MKTKAMAILLALALIAGLGIGWGTIASSPATAGCSDPPGGGPGCK
jgi:hypothetical protein